MFSKKYRKNLDFGLVFGGRSEEKSIKNCKDQKKATIFGYYVNDPERYGVVSFDSNKKVTKIEEKPPSPKSNYAVTGLYIYPSSVVDIAMSVKKSNRGEYEISDINNIFLKMEKLNVELLDKDFVWLDLSLIHI